MAKHFTIPLFIPEEGCPHRCIFCNQSHITGRQKPPGAEEVVEIIESHLRTIPEGSHTEIGLLGGNFTGISVELQELYLGLAAPYLSSGAVSSIRVSTRPDYIDDEKLALLKDHGVKTIELGAQSMDDKVLAKAGRGHTVGDTENASRLIKQRGFRLGLQMMTGLPGDTEQRAMHTARRIISLGAHETRIYPCLVIKNTPLEKLFLEGKYKPQSMEEAVKLVKKLTLLFEAHNVRIIRTGLHPSEGLLSGDELLAGPFHQSFRELVLTEIWYDILNKLKAKHNKNLDLYVAPNAVNTATGHKAKNKKMLVQKFKQVHIHANVSLKNRDYEAHYS